MNRMLGLTRPLLIVASVGILTLAVSCDSEQVATPTSSPDTGKAAGPPPPPNVKSTPAPADARGESSVPMNAGAGGIVPEAGSSSGTGTQASPARQSASMTNLRRIALALHNYHDVFRAFPAAFSADENGEPLLSWRVHILPFVDANELYQQFNLSEPWNSPHNQALIARMPDVYRSPNSVAEPGNTVYLGNAADGGIFVPPANGQQAPRGTGMRDIRDGTSNTLLVVEATAAVIWTQPDDFVPNAADPLQGLGSTPGQFLTVFCDGSPRVISTHSDHPQHLETIKALFTRAGGEVPGEF